MRILLSPDAATAGAPPAVIPALAAPVAPPAAPAVPVVAVEPVKPAAAVQPPLAAPAVKPQTLLGGAEPAAAPAEPAAPAKPEGGKAPEKYDLKLPENTLLEKASLDGVEKFARSLGLSNEHAQALLERDSANLEAMVSQQLARGEQWRSEIAADKEIGGAALKESTSLAGRVVKRFGGDELLKELDASGYADYPRFFKFLVKIGRAMGNDKLVIPGTQEAPKVKESPQKALEGMYKPKPKDGEA